MLLGIEVRPKYKVIIVINRLDGLFILYYTAYYKLILIVSHYFLNKSYRTILWF